MSFQFPDPSVSTFYQSPNGEHWEYVDGAWQIEKLESGTTGTDEHHPDEDHDDAFAPYNIVAEVDQNEEQLQAISTALFNAQQKIENLEDLDFQNALSALAIAQADIIELKSKVSSLELTSFLILE